MQPTRSIVCALKLHYTLYVMRSTAACICSSGRDLGDCLLDASASPSHLPVNRKGDGEQSLRNCQKGKVLGYS
jgi:hypothetical protein